MRVKKRSILLVVAICTAVCVTGILAYYFNSLDIVNSFKSGDVNITIDEAFDTDDRWVPGEEKRKEVFFTNEGDIPLIIRIRFVPEIECCGKKVTEKNITDDFILNYRDGFQSKWTNGEDGWYYYNSVFEPGEKTDITLKSVTMSSKVGNDTRDDNHRDFSDSTHMDVKVECDVVQTGTDFTDFTDWSLIPVINENDVNYIQS